MKRTPLLHAELSKVIASMGHGDMLVLGVRLRCRVGTHRSQSAGCCHRPPTLPEANAPRTRRLCIGFQNDRVAVH